MVVTKTSRTRGHDCPIRLSECTLDSSRAFRLGAVRFFLFTRNDTSTFGMICNVGRSRVSALSIFMMPSNLQKSHDICNLCRIDNNHSRDAWLLCAFRHLFSRARIRSDQLRRLTVMSTPSDTDINQQSGRNSRYRHTECLTLKPKTPAETPFVK